MVGVFDPFLGRSLDATGTGCDAIGDGGDLHSESGNFSVEVVCASWPGD